MCNANQEDCYINFNTCKFETDNNIEISKIRIKNFGPIKEGFNEDGGWMDIKKVTAFIGNQGSGKSTVAKLISTLSWMEKAINKGKINTDYLSYNEYEKYFEFQGIKNYFLPETVIEFAGNAFSIKYDKSTEQWPAVKSFENNEYIVPKIMYVPTERNFLTAVANAFDTSNLTPSLKTFGEELRKAQIALDEKNLELPINNYKYFYDKNADTSTLIGENHTINLLEASSGLQSLIPLYLVSRNIALSIKNDIYVDDKNLSVNQIIKRSEAVAKVLNEKRYSEGERIKKIEQINAKYINKCAINIIEEPELNLFPTSQWNMLKKLLGFNNFSDGNQLIMTTHSPYIINFLSIAIQAGQLKDKIESSDKRNELIEKLNDIIPIESIISADDVIIYELDEKDGSIKKLSSFEGIPSDKNYLNQSLAKGNQLFDSLLELEEEL